MVSTLPSMAKTAVKKPRTQYQCTDCGYTCAKWLGRCPECGSWGTLEEKRVAATSKNGGGSAAVAAFTGALPTGLTPTAPALPIVRIDPASSTTTSTGIGELDRVLGSGLVPGSVVLLAGEPGVGKSTLLLEVAAKWATQPAEGEASTRDTRTALYVTAEESVGQVRMRAQRTGALKDTLFLAAESDLDVVFGHVEQLKPSLLIVDSVQTMHAPGVEGVAGGVAQSRAVTAALTALAKNTGIPILLVGHVTKDGNVAGPRVLEHLVDVVLNFEGDRHSSLRMLRGIKNRFGATDEVGCFEQVSDGIKEVEDPSGLFLSHRDDSPDGTAVTVAMDWGTPNSRGGAKPASDYTVEKSAPRGDRARCHPRSHGSCSVGCARGPKLRRQGGLHRHCGRHARARARSRPSHCACYCVCHGPQGTSRKNGGARRGGPGWGNPADTQHRPTPAGSTASWFYHRHHPQWRKSHCTWDNSPLRAGHNGRHFNGVQCLGHELPT